MKRMSQVAAGVNGYHVSIAMLAAAVLVAGVIAAQDEPQIALNVGLMLAGILLAGLSMQRLLARDAPRGMVRGLLHKTFRWVLIAGGFALTGLLLGVLSALGFIPLALVPLGAALVGVICAVIQLKRKGRPTEVPSPRYGRHLEIVLAAVSIALLALAVASTAAAEAMLVVAAMTVAGGATSSGVVAFGLTRALAVRQTLWERVLVMGEGLALLSLHVFFAVGPAMVVIWMSIVMMP